MNIPKLYGHGALAPMREAGRLTAACLRTVGAMVAPGVTTRDLDEAVQAFCRANGARSAAYRYNGFPAHCCTSVNHVAAHGIPDNRRLQRGDIVSLDVALEVNGWYGDTCATYPVGEVGVKARQLIEAARGAMLAGVAAAAPMRTTGDIGAAIQRYLATTPFVSVHELGGHGIGNVLHEQPNVASIGTAGEGVRLMPGMFITVEPIVNAGRRFVKELPSGAVVTQDRKLSAQFEHTLAITHDGVEIVTL